MACDGRFSEAWQFASFFCAEALVSNVDDSGGAGNLFLTDSQVEFVTVGVQANVGMILYNTTQNTSGQVTAVTAHTVTATGVTWDDGDAYRIVTLDARQRAEIEMNLNLAATNIHAALAASGACDCAFASWAGDYLAHLNVVVAAAFYACTCGRPAVNALSDDTRNNYREWAQNQLDAIRDGRFELCEGATGAEFPYITWAERSLTSFNIAEIIRNELLRRDT